MKISVAFIVYNGANYMRTQLDSILAQNHKVDEIIVVEDKKELIKKMGHKKLTIELQDKIKKIKTLIKKIKIRKKMGWCDDPKSIFYNKQITLPSKFSYERLYRKDRIYDLLAVLNYNINPVIKNKGSAIFIHIAKKKYKTTQGCLALKQKDLITLVGVVKKNQKIKII